MNLFDKIKDAFSNEDEKAAQAAAEQAAAEQAAAEQAAAEQAAAEQANLQAANDAAAANTAALEEAVRAAEAEKAAQDAAAAQAAEEAAAQQRAADEAAAQQKAAEEAAAAQAAQEAAAAQAAAKPVVTLDHILEMINHDADPSVPTGVAADGQLGLIIERALAQVVDYSGPMDGALGTSFIQAYARFQESLGYSGSDADGYPGRESLQALADRTGAFTVG